MIAALCVTGVMTAAMSTALAARAFTTTTVTAAPYRARHGEPVTVTARVTCTTGTLAVRRICTVGTPAGTVTFTGDGTVLGTATVHKGRARLRLTRLPPGRHEITAHYNGGRKCPPSSSEPVTVTIVPAAAPSLLPAVPVT